MIALRHWSVRHAVGLRRAYDLGLSLVPLARRALLPWVGRGRLERVLRPVERLAKKTLFDCQMCGQCVLSDTGMACPTNCRKSMRNGPCCGVRADGGCEIDPAMRCVWVEATEGRARLDAARLPTATNLAPIDHRLAGSSSWARVIADEKMAELPPGGVLPGSPPGGVLPGSPPGGVAAAREIGPFEQACRSGRFVVTVEVEPPDSADPSALIARARHFDGLVDAINITDGAGGNCHMSSAAAAAVLAAHGFAPVYQVACRDRNRIAMQGDILGAAALGVRNILCLTGDGVANGDHPQARPVFDLDSVSLLHIARAMRDRGQFASGRRLEVAPNLFLGASVNPFVPPVVHRVASLEAKVAAGAQFIQTQFCFDIPRFAAFMRQVREAGLHRHCALIVGVGTLSSAKALAWMARHVPGVHVPPEVIARIAAAPDQRAEGRQVLLETMRALTEIDGVAGVHLMGHKNEKILAEVIEAAGLRAQARPLTGPVAIAG